jgi:hypothetical protein
MQLTSVITLISNHYLGERNIMVNNRLKWCCPHCSQTSSRHWNLKKHIERKHEERGQPIQEDGWHSTTSTATHFIPDMMSLQNENNYHPNQRYQQTLSSASPYSKIEDTSKKRDILDEFLEFWRPKIQQMKEIREIKNFNELYSFSSSSQRPSTIAGLAQAPIINTTISPVTTTNPLRPTPPATSAAPAPQEQEQKKEIIRPLNNIIGKSFISSTFMAQELQRRAKEKGEDIIIDPPELSPPSMITTTSDDNNNNSKKIAGKANLTTESTKEEELEEDRHDIEEHSSSKANFLIHSDDEGDGGYNFLYFMDGKLVIMLDIGGYWVIKKDSLGDVIDTYKVTIDPLLEAQESYYQDKKKAAEIMEQKERALLDLSYNDDEY